MKNVKYLLFVFIIGLTSCETALEQAPVSDITQSNAFQNEDDAESAIIGCYNQLQTAMTGNQAVANFVAWGDARADEILTNDTGGSIVVISENLLTTTNGFVDWSAWYRLINNANTTIVNVPEIENISADKQNQIVGEALFLRSLAYFYLVRLWGDVPVVLTPFTSSNDEFQVSQSPKGSVLEQIITDLSVAEGMVPTSYSGNDATRGRATVGALNALQAHVYAWRARVENGGDADLQAALSATNKILGNSSYSPWSNYEAVFADENTPETIFSVQFNLDVFDDNNLSSSFLKEPYNERLRASIEFDPLFLTFIEARPNDVRIDVIKQEAGPSDLVNDPFVVKYKGKGQTAQGFSTSDDNVPIFRLTGIQLLKAEILAAQGSLMEAMTIVNDIRTRAGLANNVANTQDAVLDAVLDERYIELFAEGHRWFDLIRNGKATQLDDILNEEHLLWPISVQELTQNPNLVQNSFY
ncbi:RagB/SusD family nutrient uptake outer membrane protein [Spongiimicrobium sp. 3-5]|uniref:RagB/SusD family nutrient uptake outer membrane protein n=1 Tax=Spongiimicrobium sp. 3-5 TaxID=3332596 RepID=UPI0039804DBE